MAWIIEASRRWLGGAKLYRDIMDVNPPLIFYETVALSGGLLNAHAYIGGVCALIGMSALWVMRLRSPKFSCAAIAGMLLGGMTDFGQRDHLGLIFVIPMLVGERASKRERICLGLWAFLGVGLKPYLLPIPMAAAAARATLQRSVRPLFSAEIFSIAVCSVLYLLFIGFVHPAYFTDIIPLGRFVYWAYGAPFDWQLAGLSVAVMLVAAVAFVLKDRESLPLAAATLAAVANYYLQGRNWSYHLVPAVGLGILLSLWLGSRNRAAALLALVLCVGQIVRGPAKQSISAPVGARSVSIFSDHVYSAYPAVLERGAHNATRYPALWILPGAWNIMNDPRRSAQDRQRAALILTHEREVIRADVLRQSPQFIYADVSRQKQYFDYSFDYMRFIGPLPNYRRLGRIGSFEVWERERPQAPRN